LKELSVCASCEAPGSNLSIHERRSRNVNAIDFAEGVVIAEKTLLGRIKCAVCKRTFTHYPDFLIAYKRYIPHQILDLAERYCKSGRGYRKCILHQGYRPISRERDDEWLSHVSLWRWVGFLGRQVKFLHKALDLIRQRSPSNNIFRRATPIPTEKYRSDKRKRDLEQAFRLIAANHEVAGIFGNLFSPTWERS